jgi:hAT family C-terminal dimerisation region
MAAVMQQSVPSVMDPSPSASSTVSSAKKQLMAAIKAEMALFSSSVTRGRCLQTVYSSLLTVPPTSVEAERAFSAAGIFSTKLRSRLGDHSIDTLCFLRAFYIWYVRFELAIKLKLATFDSLHANQYFGIILP